MSKVVCLRIHTFKDSRASFFAELDAEGIHHSELRTFSRQTITNSAATETITALADAMPWNAIAKVIVKWIDARANRTVQVSLETEKGPMVLHAKGYSVKELEQLLPQAYAMNVIQTGKDEIET